MGNRYAEQAARPLSSDPEGAKQVAAARKSGGNKTIWLIGAAALIIVVVVAIVGIVLGNKEKAPVGDAYGSSTLSTATIDSSGVITLSQGSAGKVIDIYEDPICPFCGAFEAKFGQQIAKAVDDGALTVRYHMMNFLDANSATKDYSTRASAALMCVAQQSGSTPGVFGKFHDLLYSGDVQPKEGSSTDHTNAELAQYATDSGAGAAADCVSSGANIALAKTAFAADQATLNKVIGGVSSPVILKDMVQVNTQGDDWLTKLLAG